MSQIMQKWIKNSKNVLLGIHKSSLFSSNFDDSLLDDVALYSAWPKTVLGAMVVPIPIVSTKQNSVKAALAVALILVLY